MKPLRSIRKTNLPRSMLPHVPSQQGHYDFFCPHCRIERRLATRPNPWQPKYVFQIGLTSMVISLALWPLMGAKGLVSFVPLWAVFETVFRLRARALLVCPECGFDPFLYLQDVKKARAQVEARMRDRFKERGLPWPGEATASPAAEAGSAEEASPTSEAVAP